MTRFALVLFLAITAVSTQAATIVPSPPQVAAKAYLLVDANSGAVLAEHNADMPLPPASLTKMMTSYILAREIGEGNVQETDMVAIHCSRARH
jgi:D-alanyl-D-alanine carboxypeptidase (penicillin-binding protein 5/6)